MKKIIAVAMSLVIAGSLCACAGGSSAPATTAATAAADTAAPAEKSPDSQSAEGDAKEEKGGYKIGWSTIYLTPSWMQQTKGMLDERIEYWKEQGVVSEYTIANANGDTSTQISQIENMISQGYDAILLIAGSSTALNSVVDKCAENGVVVVNFDSPVTTDKVTCVINTSAQEYGELCAKWLAEKIGGKGEIVIFSGPAGVAVSDERQVGAENVLKDYPDIKVVATLNSEYNEAPAMEVINPVLDANPDLSGILSLGGSLSSASLKAVEEKGMNLIPITGENYNAFLKKWAELKDQGFSSFAVGQPNWLGVLSLDQSIRILNGEKYDKNIVVPLPQYTDDNLSEYVPNDFAEDGYPVSNITQEQIDEYLTPQG